MGPNRGQLAGLRGSSRDAQRAEPEPLLWVTITQVIRRSRMISSTRSSTFRAAVVSSSAEVGSSRRRISGAFAERAGDRYALSLASGEIAHVSVPHTQADRRAEGEQQSARREGLARADAARTRRFRPRFRERDTPPASPCRYAAPQLLLAPALGSPDHRAGRCRLVGSSSRFSKRRKDVFPDPLGPTTARTSPTCTWTLISLYEDLSGDDPG